MFHVEVRQFPNVARAFNLSEDDLRRRILEPWLSDRGVELDERQFSADRARLTIYEGPELQTDQIGMGRGWGNVTRSGREVTTDVLEAARSAAVTPLQAATAELKAEIARRAEIAPLSLPEVLRVANERHPGWRLSDRVAVAESAVWELLHQGGVRMRREGEPVDPGSWEAAILDWDSWSAETDASPVLIV